MTWKNLRKHNRNTCFGLGRKDPALSKVCLNNKLLKRVTSVIPDISYLLHLTQVPKKATKSIRH